MNEIIPHKECPRCGFKMGEDWVGETVMAAQIRAGQRRERLEIATAAMQGWLSTYAYDSEFPDEPRWGDIANNCFGLADAMLAEAKKEPT